MAETLLQYRKPVATPDSTLYWARACGSATRHGLWQGWLEFTPVDDGPPVRSGRETTQPNRVDTVYWATGLSAVYLEGALRRALEGPVRVPVTPSESPAFSDSERSVVMAAAADSSPRAVLDPFSVFQKGETLLRRQLTALSARHLVNIIIEYELSAEPAAGLNQLPHRALMDIIVIGVRDEAGLRSFRSGGSSRTIR